jgi:hypothetical protein
MREAASVWTLDATADAAALARRVHERWRSVAPIALPLQARGRTG